MLRKVHDHISHLRSKIVLDRLRFRVCWPKMAIDKREYICGCLPCAKWVKSLNQFRLLRFKLESHIFTLTLSLMLAQTMLLFCFIIIFKLIPSLMRCMYMDAGLHFTSQKLRMYFQKKDIAVVFAHSTSHKSVSIIEKSNNILQQAFKKMRELVKEWEDALFRTTPQFNSCIIEDLYRLFPVEIITGVQPLTSIKRKIQIDSLPTQLKVPTEEQMFLLVWDHMA